MNHNGYFMLAVDDGGFYRTFPDEKGAVIDPSAYTNLARLAEEFDTQIIIACTTSFLDIKRASRHPRPHANTTRILDTLEKHSDRLIVADHGYSHTLGSAYKEFYDHRSGQRLTRSLQTDHVEQSISVYRSLGWPVPELFIPPAHGWEPGVTDQILSEYGFRYLSSILWVKQGFPSMRQSPAGFLRDFQTPEHVYPDRSKFLTILPRLGLGIPSYRTRIPSHMWYRAYASVLPASRLNQLLWHRHRVTNPHNYMAHIANFCFDANYRSWRKLLERIVDKKMQIAPSFKSSLEVWPADQMPG